MNIDIIRSVRDILENDWAKAKEWKVSLIEE